MRNEGVRALALATLAIFLVLIVALSARRGRDGYSVGSQIEPHLPAAEWKGTPYAGCCGGCREGFRAPDLIGDGRPQCISRVGDLRPPAGRPTPEVAHTYWGPRGYVPSHCPHPDVASGARRPTPEERDREWMTHGGSRGWTQSPYY